TRRPRPGHSGGLRQLALAGKGADVDDQGHAAVAEDGRAGDAGHAPVVLLEVLDHHLLLADQLLDLQRQLLAVAFDHHHQRFGAVLAEAEGARKRQQRQVLAAHAQHPAVAGHAADVLGLRLQRLKHVGQRQDQDLAARVPRPALLSSCTSPPRAWMFLRTTSMPTPRPDRSVTSSAVEKPGWKIRSQTCASLGLSGIARPRSVALARILSRLRPRPSSATSITMCPPWCEAARVMVPVSSLPAALRASGSSRPWSIELR